MRRPLAAPERLARIVLGVTGGIAAYKAAELTRLFVKAGVARRRRDDRRGHAASSRRRRSRRCRAGRSLTDLWQSGADDAMGHIDVSRGADAIVVAPASADFLAKLAHGTRRRPAVDAVPRARVPAVRRARDEPADVGEPGDAAQRRAAARRRRRDPRARHRRARVQGERRRPHARSRRRSSPRSSRRASRRCSPASACC